MDYVTFQMATFYKITLVNVCSNNVMVLFVGINIITNTKLVKISRFSQIILIFFIHFEKIRLINVNAIIFFDRVTSPLH